MAGAVMLMASAAQAQTAGPPALSAAPVLTQNAQSPALPQSGQPSAGVQNGQAANVPAAVPSRPVPIVPPSVQKDGDGAQAAEAKAETKTELQGTPFPNMAPGSPHQPPLSNRGMGLDVDQTRKDMDQLKSQTNKRLDEIKTGLGTPAQAGQTAGQPANQALPSPDMSGYTSELQELSALQRSTRLMQARRQEAEAAMAVWGVLYDPRKEDEAAKQAKEAKEADERKQVEAKEQEGTNSSRSGQSAGRSASAGTAASAATSELPLPRIVTVFGSGGHLRATLLVPYVGEVTAVPGTSLPGERRVMSVTNDGVTIHDPRMGNLSLGYGDSVPMAPPSPANQIRPGGSASGPLFNIPVPAALPPTSPLGQSK